MSSLQRSKAKAKLNGLPLEPPLPPLSLNEEDEYQDEETDDLQCKSEITQDEDSSSASSASSVGTIRPSPSKHLFARPKGGFSGGVEFEPLPWTSYFSQEFFLKNNRQDEEVIHHLYITPPTDRGPLFVTHHGAGSSGLSFAMFALEIRKALPLAGVLSFDARGHGETSVTGSRTHQEPVALDLSRERLSLDLVDVIQLTQEKLSWTELPGLILIGHSLGGAVVTEVANKGILGDSVLGFGVLDVVEGSAIDALQSMHSYLSTRPKEFPSLASGIEWHTRSRTVRNIASARISVPPLLRQESSHKEELHDKRPWTWRTDLAATQLYWEGWFTGLSKMFLEARGGKLLLLAGTDRLDKELMIGQMQGKYQLQVFPDAGHFIHEDQAEKTAVVVADFYRRNDRSALVLPPKVGEAKNKT
ncbi:MAG: hypothetical protein LQ342_005579 [Letrouitia transgressa]|nr:MAG: hypothetical protein LQ342_005579 [Letrouitia transgressa]